MIHSVKNTVTVETAATGNKGSLKNAIIKATAMPLNADHGVAVAYKMEGNVIAPSTATGI